VQTALLSEGMAATTTMKIHQEKTGQGCKKRLGVIFNNRGKVGL